MIITFQQPAIGGSTPAAFTLAPGLSTRQGASILRHEIEREVQMQKPIRALTEVPYDRGGRRVPFSFEVTLLFSDETSLFSYIVNLQAAVDCSAGDTQKWGTLVVTGEAGTGYTRTLNNAVCKNITPEPAGLSLKVTYQFVGSYWS